MKFNYFKFTLAHRSEFFGNVVLKPVIPIRISTERNSLRYAALIDSGADFSIFHAELGEYLGLDIYSGERETFGGIQERGGAEAFLHKVTLNIGGWGYKTTVGFSYDIAQHGFGILGQKGFFDLFKVIFDLSKKEIELKPRQ